KRKVSASLSVSESVALALLPSLGVVHYPVWVAILLAVATVVATIVLGRRLDAAIRTDIRAGDAPLPKGA
ncbi:MAG: hypothetical protein Q4F67_07495, partial [Propionibacteriaceae bacterium]|nr:hypothetical protein [Propionibacteriaceae bacterium]